MNRFVGPATAAALFPARAGASGAAEPAGTAIIAFLIVVAITLAITAWAGRYTRTAREFYAAGAGLRGWQNGLAIAGDFMSAATFLGVTALFFTAGFDAIIFIICPPIAYTIFVCLMAERLRNLGR